MVLPRGKQVSRGVTCEQGHGLREARMDMGWETRRVVAVSPAGFTREGLGSRRVRMSGRQGQGPRMKVSAEGERESPPLLCGRAQTFASTPSQGRVLGGTDFTCYLSPTDTATRCLQAQIHSVCQSFSRSTRQCTQVSHIIRVVLSISASQFALFKCSPPGQSWITRLSSVPITVITCDKPHRGPINTLLSRGPRN